MLDIQQLSVAYTPHAGNGKTAKAAKATVIDRLTLALPAGRLLVVLGPSGCGKSTLLSAIAGFVQPSGGKILVAGQAVTKPGADRGVVFQDDALLPWLDVLGNVGFPLELQGVARPAREQRAREALKQVDLHGVETRAIWELSGGMRQRVGLARALTADPQVLLLDEPFGALDALTRERMQQLLLRLWQATGKTVVLVTHDVEEAVFLATDLIVLSRAPASIIRRWQPDFGVRAAQGESPRAVKSLPAFIALREEVLEIVHALEPQGTPEESLAAAWDYE
jgi:taurine transport system ATP-binding protein